MNAQFKFMGQQGIVIPACVQHVDEFGKKVDEFNASAENYIESKKRFGVLFLDGVHKDVIEGLTKLCKLMRLKTRIRKMHGHELLQFSFP
jgi:hypothetical protein